MFGIDDVLTGGLSLLGGVANNIFAGQRQSDAQSFNAQQAAAQMAFQEKMYDTRFQRTADDMQKAGLNRILAANPGAVGSSPSGAMAASSPGAPVHDMLGPAVSTAMAHARLTEEIKNMQETNENIRQDTHVKHSEFIKNLEDANKTVAETQNTKDMNAITVANLSEAQLKAARAKIEQEQLENPAYKILRQTGNVGEEMQRASSALGNVPALIRAGSAVRRDRYIRTGE